jgi:hypothetical protein
VTGLASHLPSIHKAVAAEQIFSQPQKFLAYHRPTAPPLVYYLNRDLAFITIV